MTRREWVEAQAKENGLALDRHCPGDGQARYSFSELTTSGAYVRQISRCVGLREAYRFIEGYNEGRRAGISERMGRESKVVER